MGNLCSGDQDPKYENTKKVKSGTQPSSNMAKENFTEIGQMPNRSLNDPVKSKKGGLIAHMNEAKRQKQAAAEAAAADATAEVERLKMEEEEKEAALVAAEQEKERLA